MFVPADCMATSVVVEVIPLVDVFVKGCQLRDVSHVHSLMIYSKESTC